MMSLTKILNLIPIVIHGAVIKPEATVGLAALWGDGLQKIQESKQESMAKEQSVFSRWFGNGNNNKWKNSNNKTDTSATIADNKSTGNKSPDKGNGVIDRVQSAINRANSVVDSAVDHAKSIISNPTTANIQDIKNAASSLNLKDIAKNVKNPFASINNPFAEVNDKKGSIEEIDQEKLNLLEEELVDEKEDEELAKELALSAAAGDNEPDFVSETVENCLSAIWGICENGPRYKDPKDWGLSEMNSYFPQCQNFEEYCKADIFAHLVLRMKNEDYYLLKQLSDGPIGEQALAHGIIIDQEYIDWAKKQQIKEKIKENDEKIKQNESFNDESFNDESNGNDGNDGILYRIANGDPSLTKIDNGKNSSKIDNISNPESYVDIPITSILMMSSKNWWMSSGMCFSPFTELPVGSNNPYAIAQSEKAIIKDKMEIEATNIIEEDQAWLDKVKAEQDKALAKIKGYVPLPDVNTKSDVDTKLNTKSIEETIKNDAYETDHMVDRKTPLNMDGDDDNNTSKSVDDDSVDDDSSSPKDNSSSKDDEPSLPSLLGRLVYDGLSRIHTSRKEKAKEKREEEQLESNNWLPKTPPKKMPKNAMRPSQVYNSLVNVCRRKIPSTCRTTIEGLCNIRPGEDVTTNIKNQSTDDANSIENPFPATIINKYHPKCQELVETCTVANYEGEHEQGREILKEARRELEIEWRKQKTLDSENLNLRGSRLDPNKDGGKILFRKLQEKYANLEMNILSEDYNYSMKVDQCSAGFYDPKTPAVVLQPLEQLCSREPPVAPIKKKEITGCEKTSCR